MGLESPAIEAGAPAPGPAKKRSLAILNTFGLAIVLIAMFGFFSWKNANFGSLENVETLARQATIVTIAVLGATFIVISGGIDLSVGSVIAFSSVVIAIIVKDKGVGAAWWAALVGIGVGIVCGLFNGFIITRLKVIPFIVTLGTLLLFRGLAKGVAHEQGVYPDNTWITSLLAKLSDSDRWKLLPVGVWMTIVFAVLAALLLRYTVFGRSVTAVGGNQQAARYSGLRVERIQLWVYVLGGLMAGLAGVMQFSRLTVGDPTAATGLELDVIAAAVIGGTSLNGGEGSIVGSILGALIMTTLRAGLSQMGLADWVQQTITGCVIILAVALDRLRMRKTVKGWSG